MRMGFKMILTKTIYIDKKYKKNMKNYREILQVAQSSGKMKLICTNLCSYCSEETPK